MGRRLGQHFLNDPAILDRIVDALDPVPGERVIEIGPGRGTLTQRLRARDVSVAAIEYDRVLAERLAAKWPDLELVTGDALDEDWAALAGTDRFKVVGNIPYNITTPLIERALAAGAATVVFLMQQEVADRIVAAHGNKTYGSLSVGVQLAATVECLFTVRPGSFRPPPKVSSSVVRFSPRPDAPPEAGDRHFRRFVTDLFGQRRKQLGRALRTARGLSAGEAVAVLRSAGIAPEQRVEALPPEAILALYRAKGD